MMADLPVHIRKPLFDILLGYSDGAVRLHDRKWHTFALHNEAYEVPYYLTK